MTGPDGVLMVLRRLRDAQREQESTSCVMCGSQATFRLKFTKPFCDRCWGEMS